MGDFIVDCSKENLSALTQGQLMMLGLVNELQRLLLVESVKDGLTAAKSEGRVGGQPKLSKEKIYKKRPEFAKWYLEYKNRNISLQELSRLCCICRNTCYNWIRIVEGS